MWAVNKDIVVKSRDALAICEGKDLKSESCYITAALINKLRLYTTEYDKNKISLSANDVKVLLNTNKSRSTIRLILKRLVAKKYITPKKQGRKYFYDININKLFQIKTPEVLTEQASELTNILSKINILIFKKNPETEDYKNYQKTFYALLDNGFCYDGLKQILAYSGYNNIKLNPDDLSEKYELLYEKAYKSISRRTSSRFIYKLKNNLIKAKEKDTGKVVIPCSDLWSIAFNWMSKHEGILYNFYKKHSKGHEYFIGNNTFTDYKHDTAIIINKELSKFFNVINEKKSTFKITYYKKDYINDDLLEVLALFKTLSGWDVEIKELPYKSDLKTGVYINTDNKTYQLKEVTELPYLAEQVWRYIGIIDGRLKCQQLGFNSIVEFRMRDFMNKQKPIARYKKNERTKDMDYSGKLIKKESYDMALHDKLFYESFSSSESDLLFEAVAKVSNLYDNPDLLDQMVDHYVNNAPYKEIATLFDINISVLKKQFNEVIDYIKSNGAPPNI